MNQYSQGGLGTYILWIVRDERDILPEIRFRMLQTYGLAESIARIRMCVPSHMQLGARWELSVKENSMCGVLSMDRVTIEGWVDRNVHGKYHYSDSGYSTNVLLHIHLCWIFGHLLFPCFATCVPTSLDTHHTLCTIVVPPSSSLMHPIFDASPYHLLLNGAPCASKTWSFERGASERSLNQR